MRSLKLTVLTCALVLSGCMTSDKMNKLMDSWSGHNMNNLIAAWGPPSSTMADGSGGQILIYDQSRQMVLPGSATTTTTGMANGTTIYNGNGSFGTANTNVYSTAQSQTIYNPPTVIPINRKRMFWVNGQGTIYRWSWQGL
jgi:hypothetical protein